MNITLKCNKYLFRFSLVFSGHRQDGGREEGSVWRSRFYRDQDGSMASNKYPLVFEMELVGSESLEPELIRLKRDD